jgi:flavin-dependent dehydrogenase
VGEADGQTEGTGADGGLLERYDVAIMGGGLAGLTLGLQLKRARPETTVFIGEKRKGPAPEAAFKVGESTVEMSAHYFAEVVGMKDHLEANELPKAGLRFFFPAGDNSDISRRVEWGATGLPPVPSYQIDRGRFENALAERNLAAGNHLIDDCKFSDVELGDTHVLSGTRGGDALTVEARWVVDATGPVGLLKRKLGLAQEVQHRINSVWLRLAGGIDIDEWADDPEWHGRMSQPGVRRLSTNHLMGEGYWVWLIPLASGPISIGIVADPRFHPYGEMKTVDAAIEWLRRHEPQLAAVLDARRDQIEDFHGIENFAYGCSRVFSPDRWCLTGVSGVFIDPFYSPGSDFIAHGNTFITDIVTRDLNGEEPRALRRRILGLNAQYLSAFETAVPNTYTDHYPHFGNAEVMSAKLLWDFGFYWALAALPFIQGKLPDLEFAASVTGEAQRMLRAGARLEQMFRDWHKLGQLEWRDAFISNRSCAAFWQLHLDLDKPFAEDALRERYRHNAAVLEAVAVVLFHQAAMRLDGQSIDADTKINPAGIGLDPDRWEKDGLFNGTGLTLTEARAALPGIEKMLLREVVQPV